MLQTNELSGIGAIAIIDKEPGITSFELVKRIRRIFSNIKVGHAGTLDPGASGVMIMALGRATRLLRYFSSLDKAYQGEIVLGIETDTYDADGNIVRKEEKVDVDIRDITEASRSYVGQIEQIPPMYSAIKQNGIRLYELARKNIEIERPSRTVRVNYINIEETDLRNIYHFELECSSGTYVRSIIHDLGKTLGCGAHVAHLRRVRVGTFSEEEAVSLSDITFTDLLDVKLALSRVMTLQEVSDGALMKKILNGSPLKKTEIEFIERSPVALETSEGKLLGIYEPYGSGRFKPTVIFN